MNIKMLKDNAALVAGVVLPLLLILIVWGSQKIAEMAVPDPVYTLVYSDLGTSGGSGFFEVRVKDGHIVVRAKKQKTEGNYTATSHPTLVAVNATTGEKKTAELTMPDNAVEGEFVDMPVPEPFASMTIHKGDTAPDGYTVVDSYRFHGGLARDVFGGRQRGGLFISKNGRNILVATREPYWRVIDVLGWSEP